ncbi:MAG: GNAT family N-acetyltransferase [Acidimicrobiales bacterium]
MAMIVETCTFETERLLVQPWHRRRPDGCSPLDLPNAVAEMLTEPVTRHLPNSWHGSYSRHRAETWIAERDAESTVLLVGARPAGDPVGLVILTETPAGGDELVDIRLGYLLAETAWGTGLATELLGGLVEWCRPQKQIASIVGGVAEDNRGSIRVLERHGFTLMPSSTGPGDGELLYGLQLRGRPLHDR